MGSSSRPQIPQKPYHAAFGRAMHLGPNGPPLERIEHVVAISPRAFLPAYRER